MKSRDGRSSGIGNKKFEDNFDKIDWGKNTTGEVLTVEIMKKAKKKLEENTGSSTIDLLEMEIAMFQRELIAIKNNIDAIKKRIENLKKAAKL